MTKLIAILNVVAWSGFWAFGYLAVTGDGNAVVAAILAFIGAVIGVWAYLQLVRHAERTGYSKAPGRARPSGAGPVNEETIG
jgi:cell division protein FtsX